MYLRTGMPLFPFFFQQSFDPAKLATIQNESRASFGQSS
jgi:hypothetical protein